MRTGSDAIAPSSAARCEIDLSGGAATVPRRRVAGATFRSIQATGNPSSPMSVGARSAWSAAHHSVTVPCVASQEGARDMSEMLIPARPSASAISATTPGRFVTATRSSRCGTPTARSSKQARGGRAATALLPLAQVAAGAQLVASAAELRDAASIWSDSASRFAA